MHLTRRQKEILDYVAAHIAREGYAPTIEEIGHNFGLSSLATVHKHLANLQEKGLIKRAWNRSRALELVPTEMTVRAVESSRPYCPDAASWRVQMSSARTCARSSSPMQTRC